MIKIIFNCVDLKINTGGIARLNILLENYLQKKKYNFIVSTLSGYHKKFLLSSKIYNSYNSKIIFFLKNFIFQFFTNFAIYSHIALAKAHILNKNSYLIFIYGRDIWNIKSKRQIDLLKKAKYLISCSKFTINKSEKIHNVKFNNAISIWPGQGKKFFRFKNKKKHKNVNLLVVGRIVDEQKGHLKILESIMILKEKFHNLRLTIIGDGPYRKNLENYVRDFATGRYPRLWNLTASIPNLSFVGSTETLSANDFLYSTGSNVKRLYTILPNDNGKFYPNFDLLSPLSSSTFTDDLGTKILGYISLRDMITASLPADV